MLELVVFAFLLAVFTAGAAQIHAALARRFVAIVRDRNEAITRARGKSAAPFHLSHGG